MPRKRELFIYRSPMAMIHGAPPTDVELKGPYSGGLFTREEVIELAHRRDAWEGYASIDTHDRHSVGTGHRQAKPRMT
jgi:hypothetical protein